MWLCLVVAAALRPEVIEDLEPSLSALAGSERPRRRFFSRFDEADDCTPEKEYGRKALSKLGFGGESTSTDPCLWQGVWCRGCHVVEVRMKEAGFGDITELKELIELEVLELSGKQVTGDLGVLRDMTKMQRLWLSDTQTTGDLAALSHMKELRKLILNAPAMGDLASLKGLTKLQELYLSRSGTQGELSSLADMVNLEKLYVSSSTSGDLASLCNMSRMRELDLRQSLVRGDLGRLTEMRDMVKLNLRETEIAGDLKALKGMRSLWGLDLSFTATSGELAALSEMSDMERLFLTATRSSGDLRDLRKMVKMDALLLSNSQVFGDLSHLRDMEMITELFLTNTNTTGDVEALEGMKKMKELWLLNTQASGDVKALSNMTEMKVLELANSLVTGDLSVLTSLPLLERADLSGTLVHGWLGVDWLGCCRKLRELRLAASRVGSTLVDVKEVRTQLLPALQMLDVSNCSFVGSLSQMLLPLAATPLSSLLASDCGLYGDLPNLLELNIILDGWIWTGWESLLAQSLQSMDLSGNRISSLTSLPVKVRLDLARNQGPLELEPEVVRRAIRDRVDLNLRGTELGNRKDLETLLEQELQLEPSRSLANDAKGYECQDLSAPYMHVTPDLFLPKQMCQCKPGYIGYGSSCTPCGVNSFSDDWNQATCTACPMGSRAPLRTASAQGCECPYGDAKNTTGAWICECPEGEALLQEHCAQCYKLHLYCPEPGTLAEHASAVVNYARLDSSYQVFRCLEEQRCTNLTASGCVDGYAGPLCSDCAAGYRASGRRCKMCKDDLPSLSFQLVSAGLLAAVVLALGAGGIWALRHYAGNLFFNQCLALLLSQGPALLQMAQLWSVLGRLQAPEAPETATNETGQGEGGQGDALLGYVEVLQLTATELQGFASLQCRFDGATVRSIMALASPLVPLLVVLCCSVLEVYSKGMGIRLALKALTVLFIGGASGAAQLLSCQNLDGEGAAIPRELAFRPLFPELLCSESSRMAAWVDWIGLITATSYGLLIPCFLVLLFAKQHIVMLPSKNFLATKKAVEQRKVSLEIHFGEASVHLEETLLVKRLLAAAAAYIALNLRGPVLVELLKDRVTVLPLEKEHDSSESALESQMAVAERLACCRLLAQRSLLELHEDRIITGAKSLLAKYASGEHVWMEVALKLASAALVSLVAMQSLWLSMAILLGMSAIIFTVRPYAQPHMNNLQGMAFACLSVAALGFRYSKRLATRVALVAPLLLVAAQLPRPDSKPNLALRLQKELEAKLGELQSGEGVQVWASEVRLF